MNTKKNIKILPDDQLKLTNDQKNLIVLALEKQLPPEDAEFLEKMQKNERKLTDPYGKIKDYFIKKYGSEFGIIYLSSIIGGEENCKETINNIEELRALNREKKLKN